MDPYMITSFLDTCMKLLRNQKVVQGLQELITKSAEFSEPQVVRRIGQYASHTGQEMRMTAQL